MNESDILSVGKELLKNGKHYDEQKIYSNVEFLREILRYHNAQYYLNDAPIISDHEYDALFRLLKMWEESYPKLKTSDSPTQRIDLSVQSELKKVPHLTQMLSLENAFSKEDLLEWEERICKFLDAGEKPNSTVELKFDGLGISAIYEDDRLVRVATRGNGEVGEDVTLNAKTISSIPLRANFSKFGAKKVEIRGEVVIKKKDFEELNFERAERGEALFSNPRNAASGSLRQLDPNITRERKLTAFFYQISYFSPEEKIPKKYSEVPKMFHELGLLSSPFFKVCSSSEAIFDAVQKIENHREDFEFEIDGAVIKIDDFDLREKIGETNRHPRWAIAYKFPAKQEITRILNVEWQVGRTGVLTPVADLEPVDIGGVQVKRATLHNMDEIEKKDFRIGDFVVIERAGDVIPKVVTPLLDRRNNSEKRIHPPKKCPACKSVVLHTQGEVALRCENVSCPAQIKARIAHFASKNALDIENLGKETSELFVEKGLVLNFSDLFTLQKSDVLALEGFQEKSVTNLFTALEEAKKKTLWRFLAALGIPLVGQRTAKDLAEKYPIFWNLTKASVEELQEIQGVGPEVALSIVNFFKTRENMEMFQKLETAGFPLSRSAEQRENTEDGNLRHFSGKIFVFTGTLKNFSREEAQEIIEKLGAKAVSSVSKNTDYVVCGENAGSKQEKAIELGVVILTEKEFSEMIGGEKTQSKQKHGERISLF
ncbi:NAD-dependent DNA ligase LigA [Candidatus Peregrinibacteria bacterium]|nr:NAD-dependent DNA ligase LigA [Candidatus Peregrinibacteria bacterium]